MDCPDQWLWLAVFAFWVLTIELRLFQSDKILKHIIEVLKVFKDILDPKKGP